MKYYELIRSYREFIEYSQKNMAKELGITHSAYSKYEREERKIDVETFMKIIFILDITFEDLKKMYIKYVLEYYKEK